jgi:quercetin dioxygenase-like cupin family protein
MKLMLIVSTALAALVMAAAAGAAKPPPIFAQARAFGALKAPTTLTVKPGAMILDAITVRPGGSFGWHTHSSPVAVVVTSGTLTVFDPSVGKCVPFKVSKGQAFIEPADHVHLARNDTAKPVTLYAMYLGIPTGAQANNPDTQPASCGA